MKKLNLKNLKLEAENMLERTQLKTVFGGNYGGYGCAIAMRNSDGSWKGWSAPVYSYEDAYGAYSSGTNYNDGSYASGYCCASC